MLCHLLLLPLEYHADQATLCEDDGLPLAGCDGLCIHRIITNGVIEQPKARHFCIQTRGIAITET